MTIRKESEKMKHGDIIEICGKREKVYLCDRKAECNTSEFCGNICKFTTDFKHSATLSERKGATECDANTETEN